MPKIKVTCDSIFDGAETHKKGDITNVDVDQAKRLLLGSHATLLGPDDKEMALDEAASTLRLQPEEKKALGLK